MHVVVEHVTLQSFADTLAGAAGSQASWQFVSGEPATSDALREAEVYVGPRFTRAMASASPNLKLVHCTGTGVDGVARDALHPDVQVARCFGHERAVAEYCLMAVLALSRDLMRVHVNLRTGRWLSPTIAQSEPAREIAGTTVGIVGFGGIGTAVAELLDTVGMRVRAIARTQPLECPGALEWIGGVDDLPRLLSESQFVIVALPLTDETVGLFSASEFANMRPDAYLVNVARGPVVDELALEHALKAGRIAGAALDVWYSYPRGAAQMLPSTRGLEALDQVIATPHMAGATWETFEHRALQISENIARLQRQEPLVGLVPPPSQSHAEAEP